MLQKTVQPSDLALLASRAAVEVDDLLLGRPSTLDAVRRLADHLQSKLRLDKAPASMRLMDPTTVVMVRRAMNASGGAVNTIDELVARANEMTAEVPSATGDRGRLESARGFCVALSRIADSYGPSMDDGDEPHPFSN